MSRARVTAFLGMDIGAFGAGLDKANGMLGAFKRSFKIGGMASFGSLLGAGALVAGLRGAVNHAQTLRDRARETGRAIDGWTGAAARFGDTLDGIKTKALGWGAKGIGALNTAGEATGFHLGLLLERLGLRNTGQTAIGELAAHDADTAEGRRARAGANIPAGFVRDHNRQMAGLDRQENLIGATESEQIEEMRRQVADLRKEAASLTRPEDFVARKKLEMDARRIEVDAVKRSVDYAEDRKKFDEQRWDFIKEAAVKEETTGEKISRLHAQAAKEQERALDTTRKQTDRDQHRMKMLQLTAEASKLEYEWRNKPLTVAEAAAGTASGRNNTTSMGVSARKIQRFQSTADRARAQGRYDEAYRYDEMARTEEEKFAMADRAGRRAAEERAQGRAAPGTWDARYGAQIAARNAALTARYGGEFDRPDSFEQSNIEKSADAALQQAAAQLTSAAAAMVSALENADVTWE